MLKGVITALGDGMYLCRMRTPRMFVSCLGNTRQEALTRALLGLGLPSRFTL